MSDLVGTKQIAQIGLIVKDIEKTSKTWARLFGFPEPEIIVTDTVETAHTNYKGGSTPARAKLAFFHFQNIDVELIEPLGKPSTWNDQLEEHGDSLHHIAFHIKGMHDTIEKFDGNGIELVQKGDYTGGRYAYLNGVDELGLVLELLEND